MRVVLLGSGRGSNAEAILQAQQAGALGRARVAAIFSDQPQAGILALGPRFGVPARFVDPAPFRTKLEGEGEARFIAAIAAERPDLVVLAGFMRVLKPGFLQAFAGRTINLHPSLLPKFPGLDGIGQALRAGEKETGCTVHYVTAEVDGGPILAQSRVPVRPGDTPESLAARVHAAEHALLPAVIARLANPMPLAEIKAEIPAGAAEAVDELLLERGEAGWSLLEDAIARRAWIVGIFAGEAEARAHWDELAAVLPVRPLAPPATRILENRDWVDSYKAHFHAWRFGPLHWVPVWERESFRPGPGEAVLWLDPGLAFGTGNHETTRLCCERLVALAANPAGRVVDAGCGSGILALSAALLGFREISGFDLDPEAVRVSRENAALNGLEGRADFFAAGLPEGLAGRPAGVLLANIQADVLIRHARDLTGAVAAGGTLVLSGILAAERETVRAAFAAAAPGWSIDSRAMGEWCDFALTRSAP